jgi:hypothetical protein
MNRILVSGDTVDRLSVDIVNYECSSMQMIIHNINTIQYNNSPDSTIYVTCTNTSKAQIVFDLLSLTTLKTTLKINHTSKSKINPKG